MEEQSPYTKPQLHGLPPGRILDLGDLQRAFFRGAVEGKRYPYADEPYLARAADAYVKLVLEEEHARAGAG